MADAETADDLIRYAKVTSVDLGAGRCVVAIGDIVSQPLKWLECRAGRTRTWSPPTVGEQVVVLSPGGDIVGAIILRGVSSDAHPPAGTTARELIEFPDGTVIAYDAESHLLEVLASTGSVRMVARDFTLEGPVKIRGPVEVEGAITASEDVVAAGKSLKSHIHTKVQAGAAVSGPPQ